MLWAHLGREGMSRARLNGLICPKMHPSPTFSCFFRGRLRETCIRFQISGCLHYVSKFKFHTELQHLAVFSPWLARRSRKSRLGERASQKLCSGQKEGGEAMNCRADCYWLNWWDVGKGEFNSTHSLTSCHSPMWLRFTHPPNGQDWVPKPNVVLGCEDWLPSAVGAAAADLKTLFIQSLLDQTKPNQTQSW